MSDEHSLPMDKADNYIAPPVQRAVRLLRHLAEGDNAENLSRTAKALNISRTTLLRILCTLEAERFIEKRRDGKGYCLGPGFIGIAAQAFSGQDLVQIAMPILARLSETLGLSSHLGVLDGRDVLYLIRQAPNIHLASNIRIGSRLPAHATTMGRIMLAHLRDGELERLFGNVSLQAVTSKTPTSLQSLKIQLEADRALGLAWSESNYELGISSFAAPVFDHTGEVVAAINVTGPNGAFPVEGGRRGRIGETLRLAARDISERLGFTAGESRKHSMGGEQ